jgi:hypothetical protein
MITWRPRAYSASSARAGGGALVVEAGEDAVADERQQLARTALEQLQAQGEKQLVASAFAGALSADGPEPGEGAPSPTPPHPRCSYSNLARIVPSSARISASTRWLSAAEASASNTT